MRKSILAIIIVTIIVAGDFAIYAGLTYPRTTASIPVSFQVGVDSKTVSFEQPLLVDKAEVQVTVQNGAVLWRARILNGTQVVWEHSAAQGEQERYNSGWIVLPSGSYNFTFGTIGIGSLDAAASVSSKGGFW